MTAAPVLASRVMKARRESTCTLCSGATFAAATARARYCSRRCRPSHDHRHNLDQHETATTTEEKAP